ncbi:MAG: FtsX-like permease family protein [Planctomycetota bacterium]
MASTVRDIDTTLRTQARALLAADLGVESRRALAPELNDLVPDTAERTDVVELPTMASTPPTESDASEVLNSRLVELWAIDGRYPFYGELVLDPDRPLAELLAPQHAVVAPELLVDFGIAVGDEIRLGGESFTVAATIAKTPERLDFSLALGPKVFVSRAGLDRTALLGFGSRVRYRALFRVPDATREQLRAVKERVSAELPGAEYARIETFDEAQPLVREAIGRFERYLGLVALLSLILGGLGIAQVIRTWISRRAPAIATLRCLGVEPRGILFAYLTQVLIFAVVASLAGAAIGTLLAAVLPTLLSDELAAIEGGGFHWSAIGRGVALGLFVAVGFALAPLLAVWRVPPARVLRQTAEPLEAPRLLRGLGPFAIVATIAGSAWWQGRDVLFAAAFTGTLIVVAAVLWFAARLVMRIAGRIPRTALGPALRSGLASLARPAAGTVGGIVALGIGVLVVLTLYLVEDRLGGQLRAALPDRAPSSYLWDVQPSQWPQLEPLLQSHEPDRIETIPLVTARLASVDGLGVRELREQLGDRQLRPGGRRSWLLTREQRITWIDELPSHQEVIEGEWWTDEVENAVSLESEFARDIGAAVGSAIEFDIDGVIVPFRVTSLRHVEWSSFGVSFFIVVKPGSLAAAPQMRMIGLRLDNDAELELQRQLAREFPNVTVIRVRSILERVQSMLATLALGVRLLGSFTMIVGVIILGGAVAATQLRRQREVALLKAIGVPRRRILSVLGAEFIVVGVTAGLVGSIGAYALATLFLDLLLELRGTLSFVALPVSIILTALLALIAGWIAVVPAVRISPLATLRRDE